MSIAPTISAKNETRWVKRGVPDTATVATPAARTGAMVESAPTDTWRLRPSTANSTDPERNAYRPATAGMFASPAVAICSGTAMAARVRPASTSGPSHDAR